MVRPIFATYVSNCYVNSYSASTIFVSTHLIQSKNIRRNSKISREIALDTGLFWAKEIHGCGVKIP